MLLQKIAGDDLPLHFARAFVDAQRPNLAIQLLDLRALGHAHAAVHLDRGIDDLLRFFGCIELGHGGGTTVVAAPLVLLPGRARNQQRGSVNRERHLGQLCLSDSIVGERARSQSPLAREIDRLNQRPSGHPQRRCADRHPKQVERAHRDLEAFAGLTDQSIR